jgi:hypothetical protein
MSMVGNIKVILKMINIMERRRGYGQMEANMMEIEKMGK